MNIRNKFIFLLFMLSANIAHAIPYVDEAKRKVEESFDSVASSPIFGMILYTFGAIGLFIIVVILVFVLFMLLKRH